MKLSRTLLTACVALLALPAAASAQSAVPPPTGDAYVDAVVITPPTGGPALPLTPAVLGISADTTNYTTEGPGAAFPRGEFDACGQSVYGKTLWTLFTVDRTARIDVTAAGYDSVLGLASVNRDTGVPSGGPCTDRLAGRVESFPRDNLPTVRKNGIYAVQIGGFQDQSGAIAGGPVEVDFELLPPEQVIADAGLTWKPTSGGVRATFVRVDGPTGSEARVTCLRKRCGKALTVKNPKLAGVFSQPKLKRVAPGSGEKFGRKQAAPKSDASVRAATKNVFRGRKIPNGARLVAYIGSQDDDQIGQVFFWDVKRNAAGPKQIGCLEPGSTRIQRLGSCDGR